MLMLARLGYIGYETNHLCIFKNLSHDFAGILDTALRLAKFFGTSAEFWLNLQSDYDLKTTMKKSGKKIEREVLTQHEAA
ncbi:helix-turn-helix transcriptional regulator [Candidatus Neptunochlamydia vexilliferae]|uniref:Addiction module antidote protein, HigA family n=1 Tax=Candidatus Neptunichlamydia vexilliferae TaxID=1651774 RepID=A0ABS0B1Z2_9BACT|nr:hypothetical protein [Candidatus Neptunochlamydia vexilliferae]